MTEDQWKLISLLGILLLEIISFIYLEIKYCKDEKKGDK